MIKKVKTESGFYVHLTLEEVLEIYKDILTEEEVEKLKRMVNDKDLQNS